MQINYINGGDSLFPSNTIDSFSNILAKDGAGKSTYATDAQLWNAATNAVVAVQRKLCGAAGTSGMRDIRSMCICQTTGSLYVVDGSTEKVIVFSSTGEIETEIEPNNGWDPVDVAYSESLGRIIITSRAHKAVYYYNDAGSYIGRWLIPDGQIPYGVAYKPADDTLWVLQSVSGAGIGLRVYSRASGASVHSIAFGNTDLIRVRLGKDGYVYTLTDSGTITRFTDTDQAETVGESAGYRDIAADSTGSVFALRTMSVDVLDANPRTIDSNGMSWQFRDPRSIVYYDGHVFVADNGVVRKIDATSGALTSIIAKEDFSPHTVRGSRVVRNMTTPLAYSTRYSNIYPGSTGADRWRRPIVSRSSGNTYTPATPTEQTAEVPVDFIVKPGEFVWPADIRVSLRGFSALAYFKRIPPAGEWIQYIDASTMRIRYYFEIARLSPANSNLQQGEPYTVDALAYVTRL